MFIGMANDVPKVRKTVDLYGPALDALRGLKARTPGATTNDVVRVALIHEWESAKREDEDRELEGSK